MDTLNFIEATGQINAKVLFEPLGAFNAFGQSFKFEDRHKCNKSPLAWIISQMKKIGYSSMITINGYLKIEYASFGTIEHPPIPTSSSQTNAEDTFDTHKDALFIEGSSCVIRHRKVVVKDRGERIEEAWDIVFKLDQIKSITGAYGEHHHSHLRPRIKSNYAIIAQENDWNNRMSFEVNSYDVAMFEKLFSIEKNYSATESEAKQTQLNRLVIQQSQNYVSSKFAHQCFRGRDGTFIVFCEEGFAYMAQINDRRNYEFYGRGPDNYPCVAYASDRSSDDDCSRNLRITVGTLPRNLILNTAE